ncbi:hypothetical protein EV174_000873 [Coemansia sp. RSA 2320]|nr:hypothetical protein EV174_000873 [Coemansia sp. RSA 2320]
MRIFLIAAALANMSLIASGKRSDEVMVGGVLTHPNFNGTFGDGGAHHRGDAHHREDADYIAYVNLGNSLSNSTSCMGVLIDSTHVLIPQACLQSDSSTGSTTDYSQMVVTIGHPNSHKNMTTPNYQVSKLYDNSQFTVNGVASDIALLQLSSAVEPSVAKPVKLYGGDYKKSTPIKMARSTTINKDNDSAAFGMKFEDVDILDNPSCLGANTLYDSSKELCARVEVGSKQCSGELGAPIITPVDNNGHESSNSTSKDTGSTSNAGKPRAKAYALLGITYLANNTNTDTQAGCQLDEPIEYYAWVYPYIQQIATIINSTFDNITLTNTTASTTSDPYMHAVVSKQGVASRAPALSIAALMMWAVALAL